MINKDSCLPCTRTLFFFRSWNGWFSCETMDAAGQSRPFRKSPRVKTGALSSGGSGTFGIEIGPDLLTGSRVVLALHMAGKLWKEFR